MKPDFETRQEIKEAINEANGIDVNITMSELLDKYSIHQALRLMARIYGENERKTATLCKKLAKQTIDYLY